MQNPAQKPIYLQLPKAVVDAAEIAAIDWLDQSQVVIHLRSGAAIQSHVDYRELETGFLDATQVSIWEVGTPGSTE